MVNKLSLTETTQGETLAYASYWLVVQLQVFLLKRTCWPWLLLDQPFNPTQTTSHKKTHTESERERERHPYTTRWYASKKQECKTQIIMLRGPHLMIAMQYSMANISSESEESQNWSALELSTASFGWSVLKFTKEIHAVALFFGRN